MPSVYATVQKPLVPDFIPFGADVNINSNAIN
jgi:hypothetical protein